MPLIDLTVKHGATLPEARSRLESAVDEGRKRFGPMIQRVEWSPDRDAVALSGIGFRIDMRVDAETVHVTGDVPLLAGLLGGDPAAKVRGMIESSFRKPRG